MFIVKWIATDKQVNQPEKNVQATVEAQTNKISSG
jgi:hypothetical protein